MKRKFINETVLRIISNLRQLDREGVRVKMRDVFTHLSYPECTKI